MKHCYFSFLLMTACFSLSAQTPSATGTWTWVNGDKTINANSSYVLKGDFSFSNKPGARYASATAELPNGGFFFLFGGGFDNDGTRLYSDLWIYYPGKNEWAWMSGDSLPNHNGVYGRKGIASPNNKPGARSNAISWIDNNGTFWLFGGTGYASFGDPGYLNDLWQWTQQKGWVWIAGDTIINRFGIYGTQHQYSTQNNPGARKGAVCWTDASGNGWLFGGMGYSNANSPAPGSLNDLWEFNVSSNQWVWVSGGQNLNVPGVYGSKGVAASTNLPGTRQYAVGWKDNSGNLWLHGGQASSQQALGLYDDLWKFDPLKNLWTWISGDNTFNQPPVYSSAGKAGGRAAALSWTDTKGNFWLFGGYGYDAQSEKGYLNDLWKYNAANGSWIWMSTDKLINRNGVYGTLRQGSTTNKPGSRYFSAGWTDAQNGLWLFGGAGYAEQSNGNLNDLFLYTAPSPLTCPSSVVMKNDTFCVLPVYNIDPVFSDPNLKSNFILSGATVATGAGSASGFKFNPGITSVLYQLTTDTTQKCSFTVEVDDKTAPVPLIDSLPVISGDCYVTVTDRPKAKDNCAGIVTGTTSDSLNYTKQGTYTITWTYKDGYNNISTQRQTVIVKSGSGVLAPLVPSLPDIIGACSVKVTTIPQASKSCAGIFNGTTNDPLSYTKQGTYIITWNYTDNTETTIHQQQRVIVKDSIAPVPAKDTLGDIISDCSVTVTDIPTATDNCAGKIMATTSDPLSYSLKGTYIIHWVFDDGNGNKTNRQQRVIVNTGSGTLTPLVANLPDIVGSCAVTVTAIPQASKSCAGIFNGTTNDPLSYTKQGTYIITWNYTDNNETTIHQQQRVIVKDSIAPVPVKAVLPDITGSCSVLVTSIPTAADNCAGTIQASTADPLSYTGLGVYTINWVYNDGNGNSITQQQKVTVNAGTGPVKPLVDSLPDITAECSATVTTRPQASGSCGSIISGTTTDPLSFSTQGVHIVNWVYTDNNGNSITQAQRVIIKDRTAPMPDLAVLPDITGTCSVTVSNRPTATDNCSGKITATTKDPLTYNKKGTHVINWVYTDASGNQQIQQQNVIIVIPVALEPRFLVLPDIVSECSVVISTPPTIKDFCLGNISGTTTDSLSYTRPGTYTIYWNYITSNEDTVVQKQTVIVKNLALTINAFPNPASNQFNVTVKSCNKTEKISLRVYDILGRIIENRMVQADQSIILGTSYPAANYAIQVMQGNERITQKVIKIK